MTKLFVSIALSSFRRSRQTILRHLTGIRPWDGKVVSALTPNYPPAFGGLLQIPLLSRFGAHAKLSSGLQQFSCLVISLVVSALTPNYPPAKVRKSQQNQISRFGAHAKLSSGMVCQGLVQQLCRFGAHAKLSSGKLLYKHRVTNKSFRRSRQTILRR